MKLVRRPNGVWALRYRDESGNRRVLSMGTRERAEAEQEASRIMRGETTTRKLQRMTLEKALWDTYERVWSRQKSAREKKYMVAYLARSKLAGKVVDEITYPVLVEAAEDWLDHGLAPATVNRKLATISKALGECVKLGYLTSVPPMPHQIERNGKLRYLSRDEEGQLVEACGRVMVEADADDMRNLIVFLVDTGARLSEALGARLTRVPATQVTFAETKNGRTRTVPLTGRAGLALSRLPDWNKARCVRQFTRVRDEAKLPDVSLHTLRHTCASRLVQGGMDLYRVKAWLGHSTITVTERYAHLAPSALQDGAAILGGRAEIAPSNLRTEVGQAGTTAPAVTPSGTLQRSVPTLRIVK